MIAVVGLGGAGGNCADEAIKRGFYGVAINYSQRDLDALEYVENKLKLKGSEGVGKNREEATALLSTQYDGVVKWIIDHVSSPSIKIIAFYYATSGGSGSGIAPLLIELVQSILSEIAPDKRVIAFPILPDLSEDETAQLNCLAASEELSRLNVLSFPIDNQQVKNETPNIPKNKLYEITNTNAVYLLHSLVSYIEQSSKNGNFDEQDLLTILGTKGVGHICEVNLKTPMNIEKTSQGLTSIIHEQWKKSIFAPINYQHVTRAAVIFDGDEKFTELISLQDIFSIFDKGTPIGSYEGYYHTSANRIITVLAGLPWFTSRLKQIEHIIEQNTNKIETVLSSQADTSYVSSVSGIASKLISPIKSTPKSSTADIVAKYKR
jgi:tubulin-like protein CetZ